MASFTSTEATWNIFRYLSKDEGSEEVEMDDEDVETGAGL